MVRAPCETIEPSMADGYSSLHRMQIETVDRVKAQEPAENGGKKCWFCNLLRQDTGNGPALGDCQQFECGKVRRRRIAKHASLARKGDRLSGLYSLRFGQLKLIGGDQHEQRVAGFHMPGDIIGLESIAVGRHRFRLLALEDCEVCEIPFPSLAALTARQPECQREFMNAFSAALNDEYSRSAILSMNSLEQRFVGFLLNVGEKYARLGYSSNSFRLSMTRGDIGSYLGTSIESISRLISRFNGRGVTLISGRTVDLLDRHHLEALARGDSEPHGARSPTSPTPNPLA